MTYTLSRLAPGSYDVLLNGVIIASLVQSGETDNRDFFPRTIGLPRSSSRQGT